MTMTASASKLNRREFLARTACTAALTGALLSKSAAADPLGLPVGIQLYTVADDMLKDAPAAVAKIAQIGYKEVETAGFGSLSSAAALRKVFDANGLKCPSAHLTFDLKNLNKAFDDALALGCTYATSSVPRLMIMDMTVPTGIPAAERQAAVRKMMTAVNGPITMDELKKLIDVMNTIGAAAKQQGLMFASHNHTFEFHLVEGKPVIHYMIEGTDPASVKFEIDCGWAGVAGATPVDLANAYPGRIKMLHVKDFLPFEKGAEAFSADSPKGSEIGQGVIDYKKIFAGMKGKGVEHIFVEQEGPYSRMPPMQAAEVDYKYLHSLS
jgi:sugar phosphate isomerase/epimerase